MNEDCLRPSLIDGPLSPFLLGQWGSHLPLQQQQPVSFHWLTTGYKCCGFSSSMLDISLDFPCLKRAWLCWKCACGTSDDKFHGECLKKVTDSYCKMMEPVQPVPTLILSLLALSLLTLPATFCKILQTARKICSYVHCWKSLIHDWGSVQVNGHTFAMSGPIRADSWWKWHQTWKHLISKVLLWHTWTTAFLQHLMILMKKPNTKK